MIIIDSQFKSLTVYVIVEMDSSIVLYSLMIKKSLRPNDACKINTVHIMTCLRVKSWIMNVWWMLIVKIKRMVIDYTMSFEQHIELMIVYMQKEGFLGMVYCIVI